MPRDLLHLIKASGFSGVSGQNFLNHVTGAASGAGMVDYNLISWDLDQDDPGDGGETELTSPQSWALTFALTKNSRFHHIQRTDSGAVGVNISSGGVSVPGSSASLSSIAITATQVAFTLNVASKPIPGAQPNSTIASYHNPGVWGVGKWFANASYPTLPGGSNAESIEFFLDTTSGVGSPGSQVYDVDVHYTPDNGPYNPTLTDSYPILMEDRVVTLSDFEIQWSNDASTVASTGNYHTRLQSAFGESFSVYYRYRYAGSGAAFSAWQQVQWTDPRV